MRPDERRTFIQDEDRALDPCNDDQVSAWAERYQVDPQDIREICEEVGPNRTAVELKLAAPRA